MSKQFRYEAIKLFNQRTDLIKSLFDRYINNTHPEKK